MKWRWGEEGLGVLGGSESTKRTFSCFLAWILVVFPGLTAVGGAHWWDHGRGR